MSPPTDSASSCPTNDADSGIARSRWKCWIRSNTKQKKNQEKGRRRSILDIVRGKDKVPVLPVKFVKTKIQGDSSRQQDKNSRETNKALHDYSIVRRSSVMAATVVGYIPGLKPKKIGKESGKQRQKKAHARTNRNGRNTELDAEEAAEEAHAIAQAELEMDDDHIYLRLDVEHVHCPVVRKPKSMADEKAIQLEIADTNASMTQRLKGIFIKTGQDVDQQMNLFKVKCGALMRAPDDLIHEHAVAVFDFLVDNCGLKTAVDTVVDLCCGLKSMPVRAALVDYHNKCVDLHNTMRGAPTSSVEEELVVNERNQRLPGAAKPRMCQISPQIAAVVDRDATIRHHKGDVMRDLWTYIDENGLYGTRRTVQCDDLLVKVLGKRKIKIADVSLAADKHVKEEGFVLSEGGL